MASLHKNIQKPCGQKKKYIPIWLYFTFILFVFMLFSSVISAIAATTAEQYNQVVSRLQQQGFDGIDQALEEFSVLAREHPLFMPVHLGIANGYLLKYEFSKKKNPNWLDEAEPHLDVLIKNGTMLAQAHWKKALVALNRNRGKEAEQQLQKALSLQPDLFEAQMVLLGYLLTNDRRKEACQLTEAWLEKSPQKSTRSRQFGDLFMAEEQYNEAASLYKQALVATPDDPVLLAALGDCYSQTGKFEEAEQVLSKALEGNPKLVRARFARGVCLSEMNRPKPAIEQFEIYRKQAPGDISVLNNLAVLYEKTGNKARAKLMWLKVKEQAKDQDHRKRAQQNLVRLLRKEKTHVAPETSAGLGKEKTP